MGRKIFGNIFWFPHWNEDNIECFWYLSTECWALEGIVLLKSMTHTSPAAETLRSPGDLQEKLQGWLWKCWLVIGNYNMGASQNNHPSIKIWGPSLLLCSYFQLLTGETEIPSPSYIIWTVWAHTYTNSVQNIVFVTSNPWVQFMCISPSTLETVVK
jgi:hypothetical protein